MATTVTLDSEIVQAVQKATNEKVRSLADDGHNLPLLDLLIAALACRCGATLAHKDAHFQTISQVLPIDLHSFLEA